MRVEQEARERCCCWVPAFSGHTTWDALLADPNVHGTNAPNTNFNLRVPGLDPSAVDLTTVTAQASWYTADLSDDGTGNLTSLTAQIGRLVARVQQLNGTTPVTLVAHSTAGVAALAFTAANPTLVQGLVTLGTPHLGSSLPFLSNSRIGDALRVLQLLRPQLAAGALRDALDFPGAGARRLQATRRRGALASRRAVPGRIVPGADHRARQHRDRRTPGSGHRQPARGRTARRSQAGAVGDRQLGAPILSPPRLLLRTCLWRACTHQSCDICRRQRGG